MSDYADQDGPDDSAYEPHGKDDGLLISDEAYGRSLDPQDPRDDPLHPSHDPRWDGYR